MPGGNWLGDWNSQWRPDTRNSDQTIIVVGRRQTVNQQYRAPLTNQPLLGVRLVRFGDPQGIDHQAFYFFEGTAGGVHSFAN